MSLTFEVHLEQAYSRKVLFALEVLDAVTLERLRTLVAPRRRRGPGLEIIAHGLKREPIVNAGGLFVWLDEEIEPLRSIEIVPHELPYERAEIQADQRRHPLHSIQLSPTVNYPFPVGITGLRGALVETRLDHRRPVTDASLRLEWFDEDGITWRAAPTLSHTDSGGDFAAILRLAPNEVPRLDAKGAVTVRLRARRSDQNERVSNPFALLQGRVADPSTYEQGGEALTFAWDELHP